MRLYRSVYARNLKAIEDDNESLLNSSYTTFDTSTTSSTSVSQSSSTYASSGCGQYPENIERNHTRGPNRMENTSIESYQDKDKKLSAPEQQSILDNFNPEEIIPNIESCEEDNEVDFLQKDYASRRRSFFINCLPVAFTQLSRDDISSSNNNDSKVDINARNNINQIQITSSSAKAEIDKKKKKKKEISNELDNVYEHNRSTNPHQFCPYIISLSV